MAARTPAVRPRRERDDESQQVLTVRHFRRTVTALPYPKQHRTQRHQHHRIDRKWTELLPHNDQSEEGREGELGGEEKRWGGDGEEGDTMGVEEVVEAKEETDDGARYQQFCLGQEVGVRPTTAVAKVEDGERDEKDGESGRL